MPGVLLVSGLSVSTVGLVACASCLGRAVHGLPATMAIAVLGAGAVLALIGVQLIRAPSARVSITQLLVSSVARSALVMALIGVGIAMAFDQHFAFDMARVVGLAFPAVVVIDLLAYLSALQASLVRTRQ